MVPKLPSKKILITGGAGFIGSNLVRSLSGAGYRPHLIIRKTSNSWRIKGILKKSVIHITDLEDYKSLNSVIKKIKPEIIFHCATHGGYHFQCDVGRIINANVISTVNLLKACGELKIHSFINTGSSSEYGMKNKPMREDDLPDPVNTYGVAKLSSTLLCRQFFKSKNLPVVTLRLFSPYGYYEDSRRLVACAILSCLNKKELKFSSCNLVRDFIFIEDAIKAYFSAVIHIDKSKGEIINIGSGKQHTIGDVVCQVIKLTGSKSKPQWDVVCNRRPEPVSWQAVILKANKLIDWKPRVSFSEGLRKTVKWFKINKNIYE